MHKAAYLWRYVSGWMQFHLLRRPLERGDLRCSFCLKNYAEETEGVLGINSYVCGDCVALAARAISEKRSNLPIGGFEGSA